MTSMQRVKKILLALLMLLCCVILVMYPGPGFYLVAVIVSVSLIVYGLRMLLYYLTMARHMVGGKTVFYIGVIVFDLGIFILTTADNPKLFVVIYLLVAHAFSGVMAVLRAREAKGFSSPGWKWILLGGIANLVIAVLAVIAWLSLRSETDLAYLYAASLFYSACIQIVSACKKTAIVYVP